MSDLTAVPSFTPPLQPPADDVGYQTPYCVVVLIEINPSIKQHKMTSCAFNVQGEYVFFIKREKLGKAIAALMNIQNETNLRQ